MFGLVSNLCQRCRKADKDMKKEDEVKVALELAKQRAEEARELALAKQHAEEEARKQAIAKQLAEEEVRKQALALELAKPKLIDCLDCGKSVSR